jgi:putative transposase
MTASKKGKHEEGGYSATFLYGLTEPENISRLRESFRYVMKRHPFVMDAVVVLPDHFHCIWRMPEEDADFSTRLRLIKRHFSIGMK